MVFLFQRCIVVLRSTQGREREGPKVTCWPKNSPDTL